MYSLKVCHKTVCGTTRRGLGGASGDGKDIRGRF